MGRGRPVCPRLRANLVGRDLLFVGFWSDWAYLNSVLVDAIDANRFTLVVLVDPESPEKLQQKAPELWAWAKRQGFVHVPVSGADFLDELRALFCRSFINRLLARATGSWPAWAGTLGPTQALPETLTTEDLFALRRDSCGKPTHQVVTEKPPTAAMSTTGVAHLCFLNKGALVDGARYTIANKRLRVVNGAGMLLASAAERAPSGQSQNSRFGFYGAIGLPPTHRTKRDEWGTHIVDVPLEGWASRRGPQGLKPVS